MKAPPQPLTPDQQKLAAAWLPLARSLIAKQARTQTEREDLLSAVQPTLCKAASKFDPTKGWTEQAYMTRAIKNAMIDVYRKRRPEVEFKEQHLALEIRPPKPDKPAPEEPPPTAPAPQELAQWAALERLRDGATYRAARAAAAAHLHRPPSLDTVHGWARAAKIPPRPAGRPSTVDPVQVARWLRGGDRVVAVQLATGVSRRTLSRCARMFGGVSRLRRIFVHAKSEPGTTRNHKPSSPRATCPARCRSRRTRAPR